MSFVQISLGVILLTQLVQSRAASCDRFDFRDYWQCSKYPVLTCDDIRGLEIVSPIAQGTVKNVFLAKWRDYHVVLSTLTSREFEEDFRHNIAMHQLLDGPYTVRMLGSCEDSIVTEYHPRGNIMSAMPSLNDSLEFRFPMCLQYLRILRFLHRHERVMCDSNSLPKILEQFLVSNSGKLLLNDMDALPRKEKGVVRCGKKMLDGEFVAPEQRLEAGYRKGYDEMTDMFKAPHVCDYILGEAEYAIWFRYWLFDINKRCEAQDPKLRPSAKELIRDYLDVWKEYQNDTRSDSGWI